MTLDRLATLPVELQHRVLSELLPVSTACALELFVPDWGVCAHATDPVNEIYDLQRVDVYTRGIGGGRGKLDSRAHHGDDDHAFYPSKKEMDPRVLRALLQRFPVAMEWALRDRARNCLRCFRQLWPRGPDDEIGKCMSGGGLVFGEGGRPAHALSVEGPAAGPALGVGQLPRHLMFNGFAKDPWFQLRLRRNALTNFGVEMKIFIEVGASLVEVEWGALAQLETLFLDLRAYGRDQPQEEAIRKGAAGMKCLRLECLVIAGLRSGNRYVRPAGWESCEWERDEREIDGEVNWVKVFCGALREGGRLVFVDRRMLDINWESWRMRAEKEGLLPVVEEARLGECGDGAYLRHVDKVLDEGEV